MITDQYAEDRIRSWLLETAPRQVPDRVLTATYDRTRRMAQGSSVRTWWSRATRPLPIAFAAGALAIVVVLVNGRVGSLGGGANRPLGVQFGSTAQISGQWTTAQSEAFSVQFASPEDEHLYWRAAVYDTFDLTGWRQTVSGGYDVPAGEEVLATSGEPVTETGRRAVTFRVFPTDFRGALIVSPRSPQRIDTPVRVSYVGDERFIASVDRAGGDPYTVTALVRERGDDNDGALTINRLRAAGTVYPPEIRTHYLTVPDGAIPSGGKAEELLEDILAEVADPDNPYDVASTMVDYLQSSDNFTYDADVRDLACEGLSTVECFARFRHGYCQHYATTMAILLREHGIPTRLAAGFLPGERDDSRLFERVSVSAAHAWVEVYFPGYGWLEFDPTGGGVAQLPALP
jgi:transglutaminase-like putative cysteine protease